MSARKMNSGRTDELAGAPRLLPPVADIEPAFQLPSPGNLQFTTGARTEGAEDDRLWLPGTAPIGVVIPTYNEQETIGSLIDTLTRILGQRLIVVVVDDSSRDDTQKLVHRLSERNGNVRLLKRPAKLGIGSAVRDGIRYLLLSTGCEYIVTMDADGSHNPTELPRLLRAASQADLVQGSRYVHGGTAINWPLSRRLLSSLSNSVCRILLRSGMKEHTTYFRVYSPKSAQLVAGTTRLAGWAWAVESLSVILAQRMSVVEVPITFTDRQDGRSKLTARGMFDWMLGLLWLFVNQGSRSGRIKGLEEPTENVLGNFRLERRA